MMEVAAAKSKVGKPGGRRQGVVVPHAPRWYQRLAGWCIFAAVRLVGATVRFRWRDTTGYLSSKPNSPAIYCIWHNRLALCMSVHQYIKRHVETEGLAVMVSASKDGGFLAGVLECFRVQPVRGSSSRRGHQALLELTTWAERGYDLAITPDGPRGPRYVVQEGVTSLAQLTGFPIVPVSYQPSWKVTLKSWDRFHIPLPFSKCEVTFGKPIRIPREASEEQREGYRQELEATLKAISKE